MAPHRVVAHSIVSGVWRDLSARKGIGDELDSLDLDITLEVKESLVDAVELELMRSYG